MKPRPQIPPEPTTGSTADDVEIRGQLFDMLAGFMRTQALSTVAKLGIPDIVSTEALDVAAIADAVGAHEPSLYRLLRFLATEGVFAEVEPRRFAATALSDGLRTDARLSTRWLAIMFGSEQYRCWGESLYSFSSGEPAFEHVHGQPFFEFLVTHPEASTNFNRAMAAGTQARVAPLQAYDWRGIGTVADIGGGTGAALTAVVSSQPHLRGVLFDLPSVAPGAKEIFRREGIADRCTIVAGDFFVDPLPPADVYVLSQILHDWSDERASSILRNCRRALGADDRLLLVEGVVPEDRKPDFMKLFDLHMLVLLGGKERTVTEWRALLDSAGFTLEAISTGLLEARPT